MVRGLGESKRRSFFVVSHGPPRRLPNLDSRAFGIMMSTVQVDYIPCLVVTTVALWLARKIWPFLRPKNPHSVAIVVLGDIGRSPRTAMYHAESFLENGCFTDIIGYGGPKLNN
jgi:hypothetical protein